MAKDSDGYCGEPRSSIVNSPCDDGGLLREAAITKKGAESFSNRPKPLRLSGLPPVSSVRSKVKPAVEARVTNRFKRHGQRAVAGQGLASCACLLATIFGVIGKRRCRHDGKGNNTTKCEGCPAP